MQLYQLRDLLQFRNDMAMKVCGIFDPDEVGDIYPISYPEPSAGHTFWTIWLFGNKKIYSAMIEPVPGVWDDPLQAMGRTFFDVYRFKNISDIRVDDYGCVITLRTGKKLEMTSNTFEGFDAFQRSARGLVRLWDEYDD